MRVPRLHPLVVMMLAATAAAMAQDTTPLPVRKVVLYKNGIGYFEHVGGVRGSQTVEIALPSAQLNDVLKSLTVLDLSGGQVAGVSYDSSAPLSQRLAELPINPNNTEGLVGLLNQFRGTGIELRAPSGSVAGKLMGAERRMRSTGPGAASEFVQVSVFSAAGEVRVVELESVGSLRLTDPGLSAELGRYLDLLNTRYQRDIRKLRIQTAGSGDRQLYVSYTSEAPIWKTTYRIVLDPRQKPLLQGWAIVDNTTPNDWLNVGLSLVAGAPISFIQNLSQPVYGRRPVVPLPQGVQVSPQVHDGTLVSPQATSVAAAREEEYVEPAKEAVESRLERAGRPMALRAAAPAPEPAVAPMMDMSEAIRAQAVPAAAAQALAEQFEYRLRQPVTIRRNESALLPVVHAEIGGEKVSVLSAGSSEKHPRLAYWLKNTSGLTLDGGSISFIDTNAFAGEGLVETVNPGESRLVSYAVDLATEISTAVGSEKQRVERIVVNRGVLRMQARLVEKRTYTIRNNDEKPRAVVVEHPVRGNWKLVETAQPVESSAGAYRFRVDARPKTTTELVVREESPQESTFALTNVTPEVIALWVRDRQIDAETEKALGPIVAKKNELAAIGQKIAAIEREQQEITRDQERIRGNLQRLGQSPDEASLRQRYIRQLDQQETRLGTLRAERDKLDTARNAAQKQLDELLQNLSIDRKI